MRLQSGPRGQSNPAATEGRKEGTHEPNSGGKRWTLRSPQGVYHSENWGGCQRKIPAGARSAGIRFVVRAAGRSNRSAEAGAELAEVDGVDRAAAVEIEGRVVGAEGLAEQAEVDRVHGGRAVAVAEESE